MSLLIHLHRVAERRHLTASQAREAMAAILGGEASTAQIAAFLAALRVKGETAEEVLGFAQAMRDKVTRVDPGAGGEPLLDTCGTGGDASGTFNISTVAALVAAGAGVRVAKHGNRSISSRCGSADILEALGVNIFLTAGQMGACIREVGIGFLFAPGLHPAMKHAQPARLELRMRTVFNLLGPLTNPAGATAQLVGVPSPETAELMASALAALGLNRGFVVHGRDGLDEITTTDATVALEIRDGAVHRRTITPADFGVPAASPADLKGGDREANCEIVRAVLSGRPGPPRDIVLVNASAALVVAGRASDFREGMALAARAIDSGAAAATLAGLVAFTGRVGAAADLQ